MSEVELRLFELLDKFSAGGPGAAPISSLQDACVQVPYLSSRLNGRRRYQLYRGLLLHGSTERVPDTFRQYRGEGGDAHKALAARLKQIFCDDEQIDDAEVEGFLCYFSSTTGCSFDDETTAITLALSTIIVDAELPPGVEKLRRFFQLLYELRKDFVAHAASRAFDDSLVALLRLLLQYHDPHLSRHFDHYVLDIGAFLLSWVRRLFVVGNNFREALHMWDWLLIVGDPTLTVYFALAYLIAHRQRFFAMESKEEMTAALASFVFQLPECKEDAIDPAMHDGRPVSFLSLRSGKSLAQNADIAYRNTPRVTQRVIDLLLFPNEGGIGKTPETLASYYTSYTALPLERSDFAESFAVKTEGQTEPASLSYIVVDCRSRQSFETASLPTAIHVGDDVDFDKTKLDRLALTLGDTKGSHLCIFGTGRPIVEEFNLLKMVALHLVRCGFPYVSIGGFRTLLPLIKAQAITIIGTPKSGMEGNSVGSSMAALKNGIAELLPRLELDKQEARRKAEELGKKAKSGVMAAKSWGWNILQRVGEQLASGTAPLLERDEVSHAGRTDTGGRRNDPNNGHAAREDGNQTRGDDSSSAFPRQVPGERFAHQSFSLGVDDNDDDLDLIRSVPVYTSTTVPHIDDKLPLFTGTLVAESLVSLSPPPAHVTSAAVTAPPVTSTLSDDIVAEIDGEFEKLFGDLGAS